MEEKKSTVDGGRDDRAVFLLTLLYSISCFTHTLQTYRLLLMFLILSTITT